MYKKLLFSFFLVGSFLPFFSYADYSSSTKEIDLYNEYLDLHSKDKDLIEYVSSNKSMMTEDESNDLSNGLLLYYKFNEILNSTLIVDSISSIDGIATSTTYMTTGKFNNSFFGNGSTSYFYLESDPVLDIQNDYSIAFWVNSTTSVSTNPQIFSKDKTSVTANRVFQVGLGSGTTNKSIRFIRFGATNNLLTNISGTKQINDGFWHHVVCVFDTNVGSSIYIDGLLNATDTVATVNNIATGSPIYIGAIKASTPQDFFRGQIDELSMYDRALSATEISLLYYDDDSRVYPFEFLDLTDTLNNVMGTTTEAFAQLKGMNIGLLIICTILFIFLGTYVFNHFSSKKKDKLIL